MRRSQQQHGSDRSPHSFRPKKRTGFGPHLLPGLRPECSVLDSLAECVEANASTVPTAVHILPVPKSGQVLVRTFCQGCDRNPVPLIPRLNAYRPTPAKVPTAVSILSVRKSGQVLVCTYVLKYVEFPRILGGMSGVLNFDELKKQWGWAGFTTQDRKRCQIMGRIIALVYNWWTIFMRLGIPDKHAEAITSRPLGLRGIARQTRHGNQTTVEITSTHAKASQIAEILTKVSGFLKRIKTTAEQLTQKARWALILSAAFRQFLGGKVIGSTGRLADATG